MSDGRGGARTGLRATRCYGRRMTWTRAWMGLAVVMGLLGCGDGHRGPHLEHDAGMSMLDAAGEDAGPGFDAGRRADAGGGDDDAGMGFDAGRMRDAGMSSCSSGGGDAFDRALCLFAAAFC